MQQNNPNRMNRQVKHPATRFKGMDIRMVTFNRRSFLRRYLKTPIAFSPPGLARDQHGLMFDCCKGGIHFISERYLEPGATIILSPCEALRNYLPVTDGCSCQAKVIWCRPCTEQELQGFKIGVQFVHPDESERRHNA
jgi:hypothetical protein